MDTTATVFGISADNARTIGKYMSWVWLLLGLGLIEWFGPYTYLVCIANFLHFNPDLAVELGNMFDYRVTIEDINLLGMLAYEFFLMMAMLGVIFVLFAFSEPSLWILVLLLLVPWAALYIEELTAPYITYTQS